jgi:hypothetical protein
MVSLWLPIVGEWTGWAIILLTLLPIGVVGGLFQDASGSIAGPIAVSEVNRPGGAAPSASEFIWMFFRWPALVWLAIMAVLCVWTAKRMRAHRSVRGLVNALILAAGWPGCFWMAMTVVAHPR